jgi:hypothetical protein
VSAADTPYPVATAVTSQAATAIPPYPPSFVVRWRAVPEDTFADLLEVGEVKRGLTRGLLMVMGDSDT